MSKFTDIYLEEILEIRKSFPLYNGDQPPLPEFSDLRDTNGQHTLEAHLYNGEQVKNYYREHVNIYYARNNDLSPQRENK